MINENNGVNYIKPEMVSSIPDVIPPPKQGPLEAVDEVFINFLLKSLKLFIFRYFI